MKSSDSLSTVPGWIGIWKCWCLRRGKLNKSAWRKTSQSIRGRTNNKLNPHMVSIPGFEPQGHNGGRRMLSPAHHASSPNDWEKRHRLEQVKMTTLHYSCASIIKILGILSHKLDLDFKINKVCFQVGREVVNYCEIRDKHSYCGQIIGTIMPM